jgi:hypothetical protein
MIGQAVLTARDRRWGLHAAPVGANAIVPANKAGTGGADTADTVRGNAVVATRAPLVIGAARAGAAAVDVALVAVLELIVAGGPVGAGEHARERRWRRLARAEVDAGLALQAGAAGAHKAGVGLGLEAAQKGAPAAVTTHSHSWPLV